MPIYAYRCEECGFAKDVLQKMSDEPLSVCPTCGKSSFVKQVTAAGFQLKGSGWYVTDFRNGSGAQAAKPAAEAGASGAAAGAASASVTPGATAATTATSAASVASATPSASPTSATSSLDTKAS